MEIDVDLCSILHAYTVVVRLGLNGCDKSFRVEAVFGRLGLGNGALTVALCIITVEFTPNQVLWTLAIAM